MAFPIFFNFKGNLTHEYDIFLCLPFDSLTVAWVYTSWYFFFVYMPFIQHGHYGRGKLLCASFWLFIKLYKRKMLLNHKRDTKEPYTFIIYLTLRYKHYVRHYPPLVLKLPCKLLVHKRNTIWNTTWIARNK